MRDAIPGDMQAMMEIARNSPTAAHWSEPDYRRIFAPGGMRREALIAEQAARVAGFIVIAAATDEWEIENVVVAPEWRRQGVGLELLRALLSRAVQQHASAIVLEVRGTNLAARALYESAGFAEVGRRPAYYKDPPEDAVMYRIELPANPIDAVPFL